MGNNLLRWRVEEESLEINSIFRLVGQLIIPLEVSVAFKNRFVLILKKKKIKFIFIF